MKYDFFVKKAKEQDDRNVFSSLKEVKGVPSDLIDFYELINPVDVEVSINEVDVLFFDYDNLVETQKMYRIVDGFVFASCNGEPIYIKNGQIYTCVFGQKEIIEEKIANSFEDYLSMIDD